MREDARSPFRDIEFGVNTMTLSHLGIIAYELKRSLRWDPGASSFRRTRRQIGFWIVRAPRTVAIVNLARRPRVRRSWIHTVTFGDLCDVGRSFCRP